ncbi:hypothetical protein B0H14DRAFT_3012838 [Mycena olivaceomarginata]|nr:hypothetical protein B0H14DRAFT_3012838 [Mycena olivaceomarginata]
MLLSIPVEDLFSSAKGLSCKFKPNVHHTGSAPESWAGIIINIESIQGENGTILTLSASANEPSRASTSTAKSPHFASMALDSSLDALVDMDRSAMSSFLMSDTSFALDYYSSFSASTSSSVGSSPPSHGDLSLQHDLDLDFASGCLSADTSVYSDFDTHDFSRQSARTPSPLLPCTPPPAGDVRTTPTSASTSVPPPSHTTFIACATQPPSGRATSPALGTASGKNGRRAQYPCQHPSCSRVLTSPYTRQVHMGTHKIKPRKAFTCTMGCGEVFTRQHDRHRHEVALHGKKCTHVCSRCKRFFSTEKMLNRHVCRGHRQGAIQWPLGDDEADDTTPSPGTTTP